MNNLIKKIQKWSIDRGLDQQSPDKQIIKLAEEMGELAGGHNKQNTSVITDSIGDVFVVMVIYCQQMGLDMRDCIEYAVSEISDRKGQMVDGVFVKEADL
ncbi:hypothetical protein GPK34_01045 [Secundilactobacillus kimchicus]|uniref:MazG-like family protein n=1 Tax=Secundilactobacillus kimchicus TaxID=528209 RepID=UPI001C009DFA|nr:MazG-like family protein [Secundilactobacillus kimchicus]MBT9670624.1 hypothetical protein [Secundilactobacillus kimchicus]